MTAMMTHTLTEDELEMRALEAAAEQRYRTMTGMDEPLADRAARARCNAERTSFTSAKPW